MHTPAATLLLLLSLATSPALAACPSTVADVLASGERALGAFAQMDTAGFNDAREAMLGELACLAEPLSPEGAARIHEVNGLKSFQVRDTATATASFKAMLEASPGWTLGEELAPTGGPVSKVLSQAAALPPSPRAPLHVPLGVVVEVDGAPATTAPTTRPFVLVVRRAPGLDGAGQVLWSGLARGGEALPVSLESFRVTPTAPIEPAPDAEPPVDPPSRQPASWSLRAGYTAGSLSLDLTPSQRGSQQVELHRALTQGARAEAQVWLGRAPALGLGAGGGFSQYAVDAVSQERGAAATVQAQMADVRAMAFGRLQAAERATSPRLVGGLGWSWSSTQAPGVRDGELALNTLSGHSLSLYGGLGLELGPADLELAFIEDLAAERTRSEARGALRVGLTEHVAVGIDGGRVWGAGASIFPATDEVAKGVAGEFDWRLRRAGIHLGLIW